MSTFAEADLVAVVSYAQMVARPLFQTSIDEKLDRPAVVLADYDFPEEVPCGLSGCHRWHKRGYLVLTALGIETNIGHICGEIHFGEDFKTLRRSYRARRRDSAQRSVIEEYRESKRDEFDNTIQQLIDEDYGARWAHKCWQAYREHCPSSIQDKVADMARTGNWTIERAKRVKAEDRVDLGFRRGATVEMERIGQLQGGGCLLASPRDLLMAIRRQMDEYDTIVDPSQLSPHERRTWSQWVASVPSQLEDAAMAIAGARLFYSQPNLRELLKLARDEPEREGVRRLSVAISRVQIGRGQKISADRA